MHILMWGNNKNNGVNRHIISLAGELEKHGSRVTVFLPNPAGNLAHTSRSLDMIFNIKELQKKLLYSAQAFTLIHVHDSGHLQGAAHASRRLNIPLMVSLHHYHDLLELRRQAGSMFYGIITTGYNLYHLLKTKHRLTWFIPEGIKLEEPAPRPPAEKTDLLFIGEEGCYSYPGMQSLCKAADLLDINFDVISTIKPASLKARYHGACNPLPLLSRAEISVTCGRAAAEAMAAGCATLVLGRRYGGIVSPKHVQQAAFPDLSGDTGQEPCYREIFLDLVDLVQTGERKKELQKWSLEFARMNFDLRQIGEQTVRAYREVCRHYYR